MYNYSSNLNCSQPQTLSIEEAFQCYIYFYPFYPSAVILEILLVVFTVVLNAIVIFSILSNSNTASVTVFEKILVGHSIVDGRINKIKFFLIKF